jgi:hypothetical protein
MANVCTQLSDSQRIARAKGVKIEEHSFSSIEPIESMLLDVAISKHIAAGTKDPYCTPGFFTYLMNITGENSHVTFARPVDGAPHEVTGDMDKTIVKAYTTALFDTQISRTGP